MLKNFQINLNCPEDYPLYFELTLASAFGVTTNDPEYLEVVIKSTIPHSSESVTALSGKARERARQILLDLAAFLEE
jgi:hypothetical protein